MAHMMERYFTRVTHVELIDRMTEGALKTVVGNAPIVMHEPENYDARAEIMWAGCLAHNTLFQTGRVGDWASTSWSTSSAHSTTSPTARGWPSCSRRG